MSNQLSVVYLMIPCFLIFGHLHTYSVNRCLCLLTHREYLLFPSQQNIPANFSGQNGTFVIFRFLLMMKNYVYCVFLYFRYELLWSFLWIFYLSYFSLGSCFGFDFDNFRIFSQKLTCNDAYLQLIFISTCCFYPFVLISSNFADRQNYQ